ncbi:hypothetical protein Tco_0488147 [Tanacetum coccineum]
MNENYIIKRFNIYMKCGNYGVLGEDKLKGTHSGAQKNKYEDYCSDIQYAVNMDDPNITMEEYIRLEEEKARRHGQVYNWETATYGKIWYDEDVHYLRSFEKEFPAIVYKDALTSE